MHKHAKVSPPFPSTAAWCLLLHVLQVYEPGKGLSFHFDKDEAKLVSSGEMHHPILSSVLYLTGTSADGGSREGERKCTVSGQPPCQAIAEEGGCGE